MDFLHAPILIPAHEVLISEDADARAAEKIEEIGLVELFSVQGAVDCRCFGSEEGNGRSPVGDCDMQGSGIIRDEELHVLQEGEGLGQADLPRDILRKRLVLKSRVDR